MPEVNPRRGGRFPEARDSWFQRFHPWSVDLIASGLLTRWDIMVGNTWRSGANQVACLLTAGTHRELGLVSCCLLQGEAPVRGFLEDPPPQGSTAFQQQHPLGLSTNTRIFKGHFRLTPACSKIVCLHYWESRVQEKGERCGWIESTQGMCRKETPWWDPLIRTTNIIQSQFRKETVPVLITVTVIK